MNSFYIPTYFMIFTPLNEYEFWLLSQPICYSVLESIVIVWIKNKLRLH